MRKKLENSSPDLRLVAQDGIAVDLDAAVAVNEAEILGKVD